ncbi:MAG: phage portal protein [Pseudomonadota bacterium]
MRIPQTMDSGLARRIVAEDVRAAEAEMSGPRPAPRGRGASRKYLAARPDRLVGGFDAFGASSPRAEIRRSIRGLVSHARHGARNIDYLRNFEGMSRRNVVGLKGIQLAPRPKRPDGSLDVDLKKTVAEAWSKWCETGNATVCGRLGWWHVERMAATMMQREGNFLLRMREGPSYGPHGFQVEPLPLDVVDLDLVQTLSGGRYIDGGIEFDARGRPVAVHMWTHHPDDYHGAQRRKRIRVAARDLIHVYDPTEPMQALGVPASHTALRRLNMVGRYEEAALTAAHYGAANVAAVKREASDEGPAYDDDGEMPETIEAGMVWELPPGADLANWTPNYPDGEMPEFVGHMLRGGAAGLGVAYSTLAGDLRQANFSSLRAGLDGERDGWRDLQRLLFEGMHRPVFRRWVGLATLTGGLPISPVDIERAEACATWRPRGWPSVNPKDDAAKDDADLRNRLRSPSEIAAARGEDFEEIVERLAADIETLEAAGIPLPEAIAKPKAAAPPVEGEDGAEDPEDADPVQPGDDGGDGPRET